MSPKSRAAQELLTKLEEGSAPYRDQLVEAAKFVGSDIDTICRSSNGLYTEKWQEEAVIYHGREEWLLRWLLKKLQAPSDTVPRTTASSWQILLHLISLIPLPVVARILVERRFPSILQRTLEDTKAIAGQTQDSVPEVNSNTDLPKSDDKLKSTRKRKRSGEHGNLPTSKHSLRELLEAIHSATDFIVRCTRTTPENVGEGRSSAFAAEYMRTVISISAEDASKTLGLWASVLGIPSLFRADENIPWLSPFIAIWEHHVPDSNELINFSLHCTLPLLSLKSSLESTTGIVAQIEQLLARNIIIPAKSARFENAESTLFSDLSRISVIYSPLNAACLFDIAIRTTQPQGMKRRRQHDEEWLQAVFSTLRAAMPPKKSSQNGQAVCAMLQSAIRHKVDLELPVLRSITADFGLPDDKDANWELIYMIIKLNANVFLIPDEEKNPLQKLLGQITRLSLKGSWPEISEAIMRYAPIPLMDAFAMARDLSGFIRIWFSQLVESENLRARETRKVSAACTGAWEDQMLLNEFQNVFESSLTTQQIIQVLDWLEQEAGTNNYAACIILDAISGSISQEELVDAVNLRCYRMVFDEKFFKALDKRCQRRAWKVLFNTLQWATPAMVDELAELWKTGTNHFDDLFGDEAESGSFLTAPGNQSKESEVFEAYRCACAIWSIAKAGSQMQQIAKPIISRLLLGLRNDMRTNFQHQARDVEQTQKARISKAPSQEVKGDIPGLPYLRCLIEEYPKVLILASEIDDNLVKEMMQTIFWLASINTPDATRNLDRPLPILEPLKKVWETAVQCDDILNSSTVIETTIDVMLDNSTNLNNPFIKLPTNNYFAAKALLKLPTIAIHRKQRERIMQSWLPEANKPIEHTNGLTGEPNIYDSTVLALKIKTMQQPMFYEGMSFQTLLDLADALQQPEVEHTLNSLALYKELARLTLEFILSQPEQRRNKEYIADAFIHVQKSVRKAHEKSKNSISPTSINLFEVVLKNLSAKSAVLQDLTIVDKEAVASTASLFKQILLTQLKKFVRKIMKAKPDRGQKSTNDSSTLIFSITGALVALGIKGSQVSELANEITSFVKTTNDNELSERLKWFLNFEFQDTEAVTTSPRFKFDTCTISGRQSIVDATCVAIDGLNNTAKLALLKSMLVGETADLTNLGNLLSIRHVIIAIEDGRKSKDDEDEDSSDSDEDSTFDLSTAYSILCSRLWKSTGVRQFCIISGTLEVMLSTKARCISQWNIDSTIGGISIICSQSGPRLYSSRAPTIFLHLCHLLQAVLTSHRLKLEGHFHIVVQALQALLRCLFTPLPHSSAKTLKNYAPPPWMSTGAAQLEARHAAAYTKLITLICDPSVSSVTRSRHNNLTSATDRAKRMASQYMQFVLATYIKLQLEMKMIPEVRDKMVPGLYAIFDTTTPELRRCISDGLDSSGRAVFGTLYKDYLRFGKWKGS